MNIVFHTLTGCAAAGLFTGKIEDKTKKNQTVIIYIAVFLIGIMTHGILDFLPHQYPFKADIDIIISLTFFTLFLIFIQPKFILLFCVSFFGSIFPDLVDIGPRIIKELLGISVPSFAYKIFPWHTAKYSGSIFTGEFDQSSNFLHLAVMFITTAAIFIRFDKYSRFGKGK